MSVRSAAVIANPPRSSNLLCEVQSNGSLATASADAIIVCAEALPDDDVTQYIPISLSVSVSLATAAHATTDADVSVMYVGHGQRLRVLERTSGRG